MKKRITLLIVILISLTIIYGCIKSARSDDTLPAPKNDPVTQEQALEIAKRLSDNVASPNMKFYNMRKRVEFPPLSSCYLFQVPLGVDYEDEEIIVKDPEAPGGERKTIKHWGPMHGYIWVEAETGRILRYQTSTGYLGVKNADKPMASKDELISKEDAIKTAEEIARKTNIDMRNMRLTNDGLTISKYFKTNEYFCCWSRFKEVEGVGSVEIPENLLIKIDVETGELTLLLYKIYNVDVDIHPPLISKEEAIKAAAEISKPVGKYEAEAWLYAYPGSADPGPGINKGEFAWRITFHEEGFEPRRAIVNADTGKVIDAVLMCTVKTTLVK